MFQCSPTSRVGVNQAGRRNWTKDERGFSALRRAVLGSIGIADPHSYPATSFSALRRAVLGSIRDGLDQSAALLEFQCSPTSRVGVNWNPDHVEWTDDMFQCSPTSRVGVNLIMPCVTASITAFQCSPTSRVGVNPVWRKADSPTPTCFSALRRAVLGSMWTSLLENEKMSMSQCSPTSRVGVNYGQAGLCQPYYFNVSVLSDEPCWGQLSLRMTVLAELSGFSALRRAVLGSIIKSASFLPSRLAGFSALRRAVLGSITT